MEIRQLRHFVALAEEMHFGQAARRLSITQPALSTSIARLEERFGVRLFARDNKKVELTVAGERMLRSARETLNQAGRTLGLARALADGRADRIEIGFGGPALQEGVSDIVLACRREHPEIEIVMREMPSPHQIELVRTGKLDGGLILFPMPPRGLQHVELFDDRFVICLPANHPLAGRKVIDITWLREEGFVIPPRDRAPNLHDQLFGLCALAGFSPRIDFECEGNMSSLHLVAQGLGVGFLLETLARRVPGVACVPLLHPIPRRCAYFVWNERDVAPGLSALLGGMRRFAAERRKSAAAARG